MVVTFCGRTCSRIVPEDNGVRLELAASPLVAVTGWTESEKLEYCCYRADVAMVFWEIFRRLRASLAETIGLGLFLELRRSK